MTKKIDSEDKSPIINPALSFENGQNGDDNFLDEDDFATTETIAAYKSLTFEQKALFISLRNGLYAGSYSVEDVISSSLPREAIEVIIIEALWQKGDNHWEKSEELLGGDTGVITTELGKAMVLDELVEYYFDIWIKDRSERDRFQKLANISNDQLKEAVIESVVGRENYHSAYNSNESLGIEYVNNQYHDQLKELEITDEELNSEASRQAEKCLEMGDSKRVLDLVALWSINREVLKKIEKQEDLLSGLSHIRLVVYLGPKLEKDLPLLYEKIKTDLLENLYGDVDLAEYFIEHLQLKPDISDAWYKEATLRAVTHQSAAFKLKEIIEYEGWTAPWLDEVKKKIYEHDYHEGSYTFRDSNPYEDHPNKYTVVQKKIAEAIYRSLLGKSLPESLDSDFSPTEATTENCFMILDEVYNGLNRLQERLEQIKNVPAIDRAFIYVNKNKNIKLQTLQVTLLRLLSRYLAQTSADSNEFNRSLSEDRILEIRSLIDEAISKWVDAYEIEIPLYDKLYEEFDEMRQAGDEISEIYLGRDGIYAYLGRKAQAAARKRQSQKQIKLDYLVYPRCFRDTLDFDAKREYLHSEGLTEISNPHFYDTGYTGTIPEDIMRIMGFSKEEIERRIHLISANRSQRRIKGIPETARSSVVGKIENNVKLEGSAEGLVKYPDTGEIELITAPTTPREQFLYLFLRQAFIRHYFLKEKVRDQNRAEALQAA